MVRHKVLLVCMSIFMAALLAQSEASAFDLFKIFRGKPEKPAGAQTLRSLSQNWRLSVKDHGDSDRYELTNGQLTLVVVPGIPSVLVNGEIKQLKTAPVFVDGELQIPSEITKALQEARVQPAQTPQLQAASASGLVVLLDPGHGGQDPGCIGAFGMKEKEVTLAVARYTADYLMSRGVTVKMTRTGDTFPSLNDRTRMANRVPNSLFVSIHCNASPNRNTSGIESFILDRSVSDSYRTNEAVRRYSVSDNGAQVNGDRERAIMSKISRQARTSSLYLARSVHSSLVNTTRESDRGVRYKNLHVLREDFFTPAVLLEIGFLSNPNTARNLSSPDYQRRVAYGIAQGILRYVARAQQSTGRRTASAPAAAGTSGTLALNK